jgi:hypothetical protein
LRTVRSKARIADQSNATRRSHTCAINSLLVYVGRSKTSLLDKAVRYLLDRDAARAHPAAGA